jgi:hypothetical protein
MSLCDILKQNYTEVRKYNGLSPFVKSVWLVEDGPCSTMKFSGKLQIFLLVGTYGWLEMGVLLL